MRLALYQPDIPQNTGTLLRLAACLGVSVDFIEPAGFPFSSQALKRAGMDYIEHVDLTRHLSFEDFNASRLAQAQRLILLSTKASLPYTTYSFLPSDILMVGRESAGVPDLVHQTADARVVIPMSGNLRSLNVAISAAMVLGEALRQTQTL